MKHCGKSAAENTKVPRWMVRCISQRSLWINEGPWPQWRGQAVGRRDQAHKSSNLPPRTGSSSDWEQWMPLSVCINRCQGFCHFLTSQKRPLCPYGGFFSWQSKCPTSRNPNTTPCPFSTRGRGPGAGATVGRLLGDRLEIAVLVNELLAQSAAMGPPLWHDECIPRGEGSGGALTST